MSQLFMLTTDMDVVWCDITGVLINTVLRRQTPPLYSDSTSLATDMKKCFCPGGVHIGEATTRCSGGFC